MKTKYKIQLPNGKIAIRHTKFIDKVTGAVAVYDKNKSEWSAVLTFDTPWHNSRAMIEQFSKCPYLENAQVVFYTNK